MRPTLIPILLSLLMLVSTACENMPPEELEGEADGIINGTPTNYQSWKGVISVRGGGYMGGLCTGTFIHPQVVLTAGHCVLVEGSEDFTQNPEQIIIMAGANAWMGQQIAKGNTIVAHPTWTGNINNFGTVDLALIKLNREVNIETYNVRDFPMPEDKSPGKLVGYGNDGDSGSGIHREGDTTLITVNRVIQTGDPTNTCQGDSGGPLFTQLDEQWSVTGVTSYGLSETCLPDSGSFSVNLLHNCDWLNRTMMDLVGEDLGLEFCTACDVQKTDAQWGQPCGEGYGCCADGATCRYPSDISDGTVGFCAVDCCNIDLNALNDACQDPLGSGSPRCAFFDEEMGGTYCAVMCTADKHCTDGTSCVKSSNGTSFCIATDPGTEENCVESNPSDTDLGTDTDTYADTDTDTDTDSEEAMQGDEILTAGGCGCQLTGNPTGKLTSLISFLLALFM